MKPLPCPSARVMAFSLIVALSALLAPRATATTPSCQLGVTFDGDQTARETYLSMQPTHSANRIFDQWGSTGVPPEVATDLRAGRDIVLSLSVTDWGAVANGTTQDNYIKNYLRTYKVIVQTGGNPAPLGKKYFVLQHEPENDVNTTNRTLVQFRKMQRKARTLVDAVNAEAGGTPLQVGLILTAYAFTQGNGLLYWADNTGDVGYTPHSSGQKYMQFVASDPYNWAFTQRNSPGNGTSAGDTWQHFQDIAQATVAFAAANANSGGVMPVFFTEAGCNEARTSLTLASDGSGIVISDPAGWSGSWSATGNTYGSLPRRQWRARWLSDATAWIKANSRVKMFLYFDQTYLHARGLSDPNVAAPATEHNTETINQWKAMANDNYFGGP